VRRVLGTLVVAIGLVLAVPVALLVLLGTWVVGAGARSPRRTPPAAVPHAHPLGHALTAEELSRLMVTLDSAYRHTIPLSEWLQKGADRGHHDRR